MCARQCDQSRGLVDVSWISPYPPHQMSPRGLLRGFGGFALWISPFSRDFLVRGFLCGMLRGFSFFHFSRPLWIFCGFPSIKNSLFLITAGRRFRREKTIHQAREKFTEKFTGNSRGNSRTQKSLRISEHSRGNSRRNSWTAQRSPWQSIQSVSQPTSQPASQLASQPASQATRMFFENEDVIFHISKVHQQNGYPGSPETIHTVF